MSLGVLWSVHTKPHGPWVCLKQRKQVFWSKITNTSDQSIKEQKKHKSYCEKGHSFLIRFWRNRIDHCISKNFSFFGPSKEKCLFWGRWIPQLVASVSLVLSTKPKDTLKRQAHNLQFIGQGCCGRTFVSWFPGSQECSASTLSPAVKLSRTPWVLKLVPRAASVQLRGWGWRWARGWRWAWSAGTILPLKGGAQGHGLWGTRFPELVVVAINTPLLLFLK